MTLLTLNPIMMIGWSIYLVVHYIKIYMIRYVNATGLMWENAEAFKAMLVRASEIKHACLSLVATELSITIHVQVFAEHRYYGASQPLGPESWKVDPSFLTTEQVQYGLQISRIREDGLLMGFDGSNALLKYQPRPNSRDEPTTSPQRNDNLYYPFPLQTLTPIHTSHRSTPSHRSTLLQALSDYASLVHGLTSRKGIRDR